MKVRSKAERGAACLALCCAATLGACGQGNSTDNSDAEGSDGSGGKQSDGSGGEQSDGSSDDSDGGGQSGDSGGAEMGPGGSNTAGGAPAEGGLGGEASGGASSGSGGEQSEDDCREFSCPELGECSVQMFGEPCTRTCDLGDDFVIREAEQLAQLAALDCEVLLSGLSLQGSGYENLDGLETIHRIQGDLSIASDDLTNLDGLRGLEMLDNSIFIRGVPALSSVELPALLRVGGTLDLFEIDAESIELPLLETVRERITIYDNQSLSSVNLDSLASVGSMVTGSNANLVTLNALPSLMVIDEFVAQNNPILPQCEVDEIAERIGVCFMCNNNDEEAVCD